MSVLEHIKQLSADLSPQDKQALTDYLLQNSKAQTKELNSQSLRGIWQDAFTEDFDLDAALHEIRHEWEKEWDEGAFSG